MKRFLAGLLTAATLCACTLPALAEEALPHPSDWAKAEVEEAISLDLVPDDLQEGYQSDITRLEFTHVAVHFVAAQFGMTSSDFMSHYILAPRPALPLRDADWKGEDSAVYFTDTTDRDVTAAYLLGIVEGRGNGIFAPDEPITRQEAAAMLQRTYLVYGGTPTPAAGAPTFSDSASIDGWAEDSIALMSAWGVMNGLEDGSFAPAAHYTRQQCYLTFLRLWKQGPVSAAKGNVRQLRTFEEAVQDAQNPTWDSILYRLDTPACTILHLYSGGHMHAYGYLQLVYPSGAIRSSKVTAGLDPWPDRPGLGTDISLNLDLVLSQDGKEVYLNGNDGYRYAMDLERGLVTRKLTAQEILTTTLADPDFTLKKQLDADLSVVLHGSKTDAQDPGERLWLVRPDGGITCVGENAEARPAFTDLALSKDGTALLFRYGTQKETQTIDLKTGEFVTSKD